MSLAALYPMPAGYLDELLVLVKDRIRVLDMWIRRGVTAANAFHTRLGAEVVQDGAHDIYEALYGVQGSPALRAAAEELKTAAHKLNSALDAQGLTEGEAGSPHASVAWRTVGTQVKHLWSVLRQVEKALATAQDVWLDVPVVLPHVISGVNVIFTYKTADEAQDNRVVRGVEVVRQGISMLVERAARRIPRMVEVLRRSTLIVSFLSVPRMSGGGVLHAQYDYRGKQVLMFNVSAVPQTASREDVLAKADRFAAFLAHELAHAIWFDATPAQRAVLNRALATWPARYTGRRYPEEVFAEIIQAVIDAGIGGLSQVERILMNRVFPGLLVRYGPLHPTV